MLKVLLEGLVMGLTLCIMVGPAFFTLIQTSLQNGYRSGIAFAFGIFLSDTFCVVLAYAGVSQFINNPIVAVVVGIVGGILLIGLGLYNIMRKQPQSPDGEDVVIEVRRPTWGLLMLKGFLMNIINPFVFFFWIAAIGLASKHATTSFLLFLFFAGTLLMVLATDILKALASHKIKHFLTPSFLMKLNKIAGLILIISGIILIVRVFVEQPWANH